MRVRGWCPGALRPMPTGDGLMVRVRPHASRLTAAQARGLADLAAAHGSGQIDLGSRASLQLRAVRPDGLGALQRGLAALDLLDPDARQEARRNLLTSPTAEDADTLRLVAELEAALPSAPDLGPKFGFAIDTGDRAVLGRASADIRIERAATGLILRADGMALGESVTAGTAVRRAMELAHWFAARGKDHRRMAPLIASGAVPPVGADIAPLVGEAPGPGRLGRGTCVALPFGRMGAATLRAMAVAPIRLTPWRAIVVGARLAPSPDWITDRNDPRLRLSACAGRPGCASASVETRALAARLAPLAPSGGLHVSGCAKGCAHPGPAPLTLTGRNGRFDLIRDGRAGDPPDLLALHPDDIPDLLRGPLAPPL